MSADPKAARTAALMAVHLVGWLVAAKAAQRAAYWVAQMADLMAALKAA